MAIVKKTKSFVNMKIIPRGFDKELSNKLMRKKNCFFFSFVSFFWFVIS